MLGNATENLIVKMAAMKMRLLAVSENFLKFSSKFLRKSS